MAENYLWPDNSPVIRQFVVVDDQGRFGIAYSDPVYHEGVLFAHPIDARAQIRDGKSVYLTDTPWRKDGNTFTGIWFDYDGPSFPAQVPSQTIRHITIIDDLGYLLPDKWAEQALTGSSQAGHWDYGATLGKVGGERAVKGQLPGEMTAGEAESYAREVGEPVTARAIRHAASAGHIPGARKAGRDWLIPYEGFNHYLDNRPKPGRK